MRLVLLVPLLALAACAHAPAVSVPAKRDAPAPAECVASCRRAYGSQRVEPHLFDGACTCFKPRVLITANLHATPYFLNPVSPAVPPTK